MKTPAKRKAPSFRRQLIRLGACKEALQWVGNKTLAQAWRELGDDSWHHSFWMAWLIDRAIDYHEGTAAYYARNCAEIRKKFPARVIAKAMKERFK